MHLGVLVVGGVDTGGDSLDEQLRCVLVGGQGGNGHVVAQLEILFEPSLDRGVLPCAHGLGDGGHFR